MFAILLAIALMPDAPTGYRLPDDNRMYAPLDAQKVLVLGFLVISFTTLIGFVVTTVIKTILARHAQSKPQLSTKISEATT